MPSLSERRNRKQAGAKGLWNGDGRRFALLITVQQQSFFPAPNREHGGSLSVGTRRGRRPLSTRQALHLTLRSDVASGNRSLLRNKDIVVSVIGKIEKLFSIRVYRYAICGNHLHLLLKGPSRRDLQNAFRVLAGHIAQRILQRCPLSNYERKKMSMQPGQTAHPKNQRKFWELLTYTRVVTWGREFQQVANYILRNTLEALHRIAYKPRRRSQRRPRQQSPPKARAGPHR